MKIISFCLWGKDEKYNVGAIRNAELAPKIYPGWRCRFYLEATTPEQGRTIGHEILAANPDCELEVIPKGMEGWKGMFARFLPASMDNADAFISRDCDSRIGEREAAAVQEWMDGPKLVHSMGDHPYHFNPSQALMGGMFGMKRHACPEMKTLIEQFVNQYPDAWQCDQDFLKDKIWPLVSHKVLAHSDLHSSCQPFSTPRINNDFVGSIIGPDGSRLHPEHHIAFQRIVEN